MPNPDENRLFNPTLIILAFLVIAGGLGGGLWFALNESGPSETTTGPAIQLVEEKPDREEKPEGRPAPRVQEKEPASDSPSASADSFSISGQVYVDDSQRAAADVKVEAFIADNKGFANADVVETKTDVSGAFRFDGLPRQWIWLRASGEGYPRDHSMSSDVRFNAAEGIPLEFTLRVVSGVPLEGKVLNAIGEPISNALVTAVEGLNGRKEPIESAPLGGTMFAVSGLSFGVHQRAAAVSGSEGAFKLEGLESGTYEVVAYAEGYGWATVKGAATQSDPIEIRLEPEARVVGSVRMLPSNQLVLNATISASVEAGSRRLAGDILSGATGAYRISHLPRKYSMKISATDGSVESVLYEQRGTGLGVETRQDLLLVSNRNISGRVVRAFDGLPLSDVEVVAVPSPVDYETAEPIGAPALSEAEGRFTLTTGKRVVFLRFRKQGGYQDQLTQAEFRTDVSSLELPDVEMVYGVPVSGRVLDQNTRRGVPQARVEVIPVGRSIGMRKTPRAVSGSTGAYQLEFVPPGRYYLSAEASGYQAGFYGPPNSATEGFHPIVTVGIEKPLSGMDISVLPAQTSSVSGRVVDASGSSIPNASIRLGGDLFEASASSDAQGVFSFPSVPVGAYVATAQATGFSNAETAVNVPAARPVENLVFTLIPGDSLSISGTVLDEEGRRLSGVRVFALEGRMETLFSSGQLTIDGLPSEQGMMRGLGRDKGEVLQDGRFEINDLRPGKYAVVAWADSSIDVRYDVDAGAAGVDFELHSGYNIQGTVLLPDGRSPATHYSIAAQPISEVHRNLVGDEGRQTIQSPDGTFLLEGLPEGIYTLTVQSRGVGEASVFGVEIGPELAPDLTIVLNGGGALVGKIIDSDGKPVPGVKVDLGEVSKRTAADGTFGFFGLAPDRYAITATHRGFAPLIVPALALTQGGKLDLGTLTLTQGGVLKGRVRYSSGVGARGFRVKAEPQRGMVSPTLAEELASRTDGAGNYLIPNMPQGTYRVVVEQQSGPSRAKTANVMMGQDAVVDFTVDQGSTMSGRVTVQGRPLGQSTLMFYPRGGNDLSEILTYTDAAGNYRLEGVPPGSYEAVAAEFSPLVEVPLRASVTVPDQPTFQQDFSF